MRDDKWSRVSDDDSSEAHPGSQAVRDAEPTPPVVREPKRVREVLRFAKVWAPYGGAPHEEIFVAYGLHPGQYYAQLTVLLLDATYNDLTLVQAELIREQCVQHLGANSVEKIEARYRAERTQTRSPLNPSGGE